MRDMIAIAALPSIWSHYTVQQVAESLVESLFRSLLLDFAYVSINDPKDSIQAAYSPSGCLQEAALQNLAKSLETKSLTPGLQAIANPFGAGRLPVYITPIGFNFKNGTLVTRAAREDFPTESDRLLLNMASNQTNVAIEEKWSQIRLKEANELKSSFLANMSHEIRTPLGAILGFADLLKSSKVSVSERQEYLEIITRSGQSLSRIIDDILDLSKIEANKLKIEAAPLGLIDLCQEVLDMFSDRASSKGLALNFDSTQLPSFPINSDAVRIRQVLVNLIGNAVKFTAQGSVSVRGRYTGLSDNRVRITITVTDTGIGMSESVASCLFQPFTQADNSSTRMFGGTGLGLALSKKLGNALGGDVVLTHCEENRGCTFAFDFVAEKLNHKSSHTVENKPVVSKDRQQLRGLKILVADDSLENRVLLDAIMKNYGAAVYFAEDGEEAVEKVLHHRFDVVLMDIQMPKLDGYGALAELRKRGYRKPIFALTAHAMKEERDRAIASGFVDHIPKPVNPKALVHSILTHLLH